MANIDKELEAIAKAVYGEEVRGAIHDGIKAVNDSATDSAKVAEEKASESIASADIAQTSANIAVQSAESAEGYAEEAKGYMEEASAIVGIGIATTSKAGIVKPDGYTITVDVDGTIHSSGGGGGTSDYEELDHKPKINNVELSGNKSLSDLGINIPTSLSELSDDAEHRLVTDEEKAKWDEGGGGTEIPTYTLAEYEAQKDNIPTGTQFVITDDYEEKTFVDISDNFTSVGSFVKGDIIAILNEKTKVVEAHFSGYTPSNVSARTKLMELNGYTVAKRGSNILCASSDAGAMFCECAIDTDGGVYVMPYGNARYFGFDLMFMVD